MPWTAISICLARLYCFTMLWCTRLHPRPNMGMPRTRMPLHFEHNTAWHQMQGLGARHDESPSSMLLRVQGG
jgi:hypothetical protein